MNNPSIGPTVAATLLSNNYRATVDAWCDFLHQHIHTEMIISRTTAETMGISWLAERKVAWLANELNEPWLRIIEISEAQSRTPFKHYGWLSLEINVADVDQLHKELLESPFEIIGKPANLDVSDDIRAMQAIGLDGEVLYLTQVKAKVPPFEIPQARCAVDKLFIPVAMVPDRAKANSFYDGFGNIKSYEFDTKITVINKALGLENAHRHPISVIQLAGENMIELDEVQNLELAPTKDTTLLTGLAAISFEVQTLPPDQTHFKFIQGPFVGRKACFAFGAGGEFMELIQAV